MVDSINSAGQAANIKSVQARSVAQADEKEKSSALENKDEIVISEQAISLQRAEQDAKAASQQLANNKSSTLSSDIKKLSTLV